MVDVLTSLERQIGPLVAGYQQWKQQFTSPEGEKTERMPKSERKEETVDDLMVRIKKMEES